MSRLSDPPADPHDLFRAWYEDARRHDDIKYAHAVCLSTVDAGRLPGAGRSRAGKGSRRAWSG